MSIAETLPTSLDQHWSTPEGHSLAVEYAGKLRTDLCMGDRSDFEIANGVFMVDRFDLDLISYQTAAKERIRWLSVQLAHYKQLWERR